jgi:hypothetical protein
MESARGDSQSGVSANLKQGMKTGTQAERGTPRGPSRPTSKPASTNSLARSLTVSEMDATLKMIFNLILGEKNWMQREK